MKSLLERAHLTRAAFAVLLGLVASMAVVVYLLLFEKPYLSYKNSPFPAATQFVLPGQAVSLRVVRCSTAPEPRTYLIARSLENLDTGSYTLLDESIVQVAPGCRDEISHENRVPEKLPAGRYRFVGLTAVQGTLRTWFVQWESAEFYVLPRKAGRP